MEKDNPVLEYWQRIEALPEALRSIVEDNYDYTGRPTSLRSDSNVIVAVLNKNAHEGFPGFKKDMDLIYSEKNIAEHVLSVYFNVYMGGANYIADKLTNKSETTNKPKMK